MLEDTGVGIEFCIIKYKKIIDKIISNFEIL